VRAAIKIVSANEGLREQLRELSSFAAERLQPLGFQFHGTQILPLVLGENSRVMRLAAALQERGFDIRGIRPPTVPEGTERLRVSITCNVDRDAIAAMTDALAEELWRLNP
jgi:8-amino-7-oxononanoate synthase